MSPRGTMGPPRSQRSGKASWGKGGTMERLEVLRIEKPTIAKFVNEALYSQKVVSDSEPLRGRLQPNR